jgi:hypothetical protein
VSFGGSFGFDMHGQFDVQSTCQFFVMSLFGGFGVDIVGLRLEYSLPNGFVMKLSSCEGFGTSSEDIYDDEEFFIQSPQLEMCVRNKYGFNNQYNNYAASAAYSPKVMTVAIRTSVQTVWNGVQRRRNSIDPYSTTTIVWFQCRSRSDGCGYGG